MAFENKPIPTKRGGLKINNDKSSVNQPKEDYATKFEANAKSAFKDNQEYMKKAAELTGRFKAVFADKTLPENKTQIAKDVEREVILSIVGFCKALNEDENQPQAEGAMAMITIITSMMMGQRDRINQMSYDIEGLQKEILKLSQPK